MDNQFCRLKNCTYIYYIKINDNEWKSLSCLTLCDPMDCIVPGIFQARILEWVAFPLSTGFSNPGIEPRSLALQADSLPAKPQGKPKSIGVGN